RRDAGRHTLIGTPDYMAPEQFLPGTPLTERTDLFALGLILYELLTGEHAFRKATLASTPTRPSALVANVHPTLERIVLQGLALDPRDRPASASAMADALPAIAGGRGARGRTTAATGARAWWLAVASAALVAVLAVGASFVFQRRAGALTAQDIILLADFA